MSKKQNTKKDAKNAAKPTAPEEVVHFTFQTFDPTGLDPQQMFDQYVHLGQDSRNSMSVRSLLGPLAMGLPLGAAA